MRTRRASQPSRSVSLPRPVTPRDHAPIEPLDDAITYMLALPKHEAAIKRGATPPPRAVMSTPASEPAGQSAGVAVGPERRDGDRAHVGRGRRRYAAVLYIGSETASGVLLGSLSSGQGRFSPARCQG